VIYDQRIVSEYAGLVPPPPPPADAADAAAGFDFGDDARMAAEFAPVLGRRSPPPPGRARGTAVRRRRCLSLSRCNLWVLCVPCGLGGRGGRARPQDAARLLSPPALAPRWQGWRRDNGAC
jgi:hypothetical protein